VRGSPAGEQCSLSEQPLAGLWATGRASNKRDRVSLLMAQAEFESLGATATPSPTWGAKSTQGQRLASWTHRHHAHDSEPVGREHVCIHARTRMHPPPSRRRSWHRTSQDEQANSLFPTNDSSPTNPVELSPLDNNHGAPTRTRATTTIVIFLSWSLTIKFSSSRRASMSAHASLAAGEQNSPR
jgi:hypothetical protein